MSKSNQFESPCYFLSAEEYTQDYLSLPEPQLVCLFKLRSAYALKGSPLSEDDIEGLYPVYTPVHEKTLGKVLNKFFTKKGDVFIDIRIESQIEKRAINRKRSSKTSRPSFGWNERGLEESSEPKSPRLAGSS